MKNILFTILFFSCIKCYCQKTINELKVLMDSAISLKIPSYSLKPFDAIYLLNENDHPYLYRGAFINLGFKTIDITSSKSKRLIGKKGIHAWKVVPAIVGNSLKISVIDFFITYKNKNYNYSNGGGATVIFEYSCLKGVWELMDFKQAGL